MPRSIARAATHLIGGAINPGRVVRFPGMLARPGEIAVFASKCKGDLPSRLEGLRRLSTANRRRQTDS